MKKTVSLLMLIVIAFSLFSCVSRPTKSQKQQIADTMAEYENAVISVGKQMYTLADLVESGDITAEAYEYYDDRFMQLEQIRKTLKIKYDNEFVRFTKEDASEFLASYEEPMQSAKQYLEDVLKFIEKAKG